MEVFDPHGLGDSFSFSSRIIILSCQIMIMDFPSWRKIIVLYAPYAALDLLHYITGCLASALFWPVFLWLCSHVCSNSYLCPHPAMVASNQHNSLNTNIVLIVLMVCVVLLLTICGFT